MPDEEHTYRTFCGSILSIFTVIIIMLYASYKMAIMFSFADYKVQLRDLEDYFEEMDVFGSKEGF